jgi:hypothetical protein
MEIHLLGIELHPQEGAMHIDSSRPSASLLALGSLALGLFFGP